MKFLLRILLHADNSKSTQQRLLEFLCPVVGSYHCTGCNPEKRDQIIADVDERKAKLLENAGLRRIEDLMVMSECQSVGSSRRGNE